jgi:alkylhydroperoxidase/carboxymuconolactone decarboxylase family protein YurZ
MTPGEPNSDMSERQAHAEATYARLFGPRDSSAPDNDPELMEILRRFIFGDVFDTGVLDDRIRELITVTVLACLQALPQLKSHTAAALNVGVQPIQIREAIYQLAPFVGFPRQTRRGSRPAFGHVGVRLAGSHVNHCFHDQHLLHPWLNSGQGHEGAGQFSVTVLSQMSDLGGDPC